ncbi:hypothetical protein LSH36_508g00002 [Paralvinella palmiformis]|uniref:Phosphatidylethanolamine-binding protein n=1 Tax=Paralvinella palmiformis TaxID=53620 RepID=A0AAD9MWN9_9ANNE|nr:hypothetical protein LSH36_508g00002 [Paralvinella palmiformis]
MSMSACRGVRLLISRFYSRTFPGNKLLSAMEAFTKDGVVPDVIDTVPNKMLTVKYGIDEIKPGVVRTPTQVKNQPIVEWEAESGAFYSLIMNDPDAPSRKNPKFGEWHHWLVTNIPGNSVSSGDVMSEYVGAGPPNGTGLHRYVFLLFKQQGKQDFPGLNKITNHSSNGRPKWKVREFVNKYNLGSPIAGNFFQAEYDSYCEELYKQLKD